MWHVGFAAGTVGGIVFARWFYCDDGVLQASQRCLDVLTDPEHAYPVPLFAVVGGVGGLIWQSREGGK